MNEIGYILTTIGGVISAITLFYKAFSSNKQKSFTNVIAEKDKDLKQKSQDAVFAMEKWVGYYDKQAVGNPEKAAGALNDAVKELQGKGYKINDQNVKDLEALREWAVTRLRFEQAKADVDNTVKPEPEIAENVPANEVVQPTEPETGEVNGK